MYKLFVCFLQYEEGDMYEHFRSFYEDVFPEFTTAGKVVQFKVRVLLCEAALIR